MAVYVVPMQTLTVTAGAYAALDGVGAKGSFTSLPRSGTIMAVNLFDAAKQSAALYLNLFNVDFTGVADNAAFDLIAADKTKSIGSILIAAADYKLFTNTSVATVDNIGLPYYTPSGILYYQLSTITASTPTYAAVDDVAVGISIVY